METHICVGILGNGTRCNKKVSSENGRCATHARTVHNNGPNKTQLLELRNIHKREVRLLIIEWDERIDNAGTQKEREDLVEDAKHELKALRLKHNHALTVTLRKQRDEIERTGVDPDEDAERRHRERRERQRQQREDELNLLREALAADIAVDDRQQVRELEQFANDRQNVHTTKTVELTKQMVERILKIPVPEDYRWNTVECSKTPAAVILMCKLTPKAAWQMQAKYCSDESIYDLGNGIYGKVLDGVVQYIIGSPDRDDLCKILKQEMEDNIGMCAQGNLSRLCNILAGYMEGIGQIESTSDILGRELPKLLEVNSPEERIKQALNIFKDISLPHDEWEKWLAPLIEDDDRIKPLTFYMEENRIKIVKLKYDGPDMFTVEVHFNIA